MKGFDEANAFTCEEWSEVVPGNLPMWLMVKNYLLQYILLEATYLRSACCIMGETMPATTAWHSMAQHESMAQHDTSIAQHDTLWHSMR